MKEENYTYKLIEKLREAQEKFFDDENLDGAYWAVDLIVHEMDSMFEKPLKRVIDEEHGVTFKRSY